MRWPPLYVRVLIGVVLGAMLGVAFGTSDIVFGITTADLGRVGLLVIRVLKLLAIPLVLFAVIDAIVRTEVTGVMGLRLIVICLVNVTIAFLIGVTLMNLIQPGNAWHGHIDELLELAKDKPKQAPEGTSLSLMDNVEQWIPENFVDPFQKNSVIPIVLLAIFAGIALRRISKDPDASESAKTLASFVNGGFHLAMQMLLLVIEAVPFAVFGIVSHVVGKTGLETFVALGGFLGVILCGMAIHAFGYYPLVAWFVGRMHPRDYLGRGGNAIITGLSTNSSLATVPVTLKALDSMGVSPESSRLAACVGTNLNNDGITLYEAMAAIFLAQALGYDLSIGAQLTIVVASLMAGIGIAGIPEAGLIVLPLVLSAAGLPEPVVLAVIPVLFTVDWILARARTIVNVMADMLVAILLDRWSGRSRR
jgi:Na+/H+-dicarboxylate symporter